MVLISTSVLSLPGRHPIIPWLLRYVVDVCLVIHCFLFIEVCLSSHSRVTVSTCHRPLSVGLCCRPSAIEVSRVVAEIIEIVKHEVHVLLLFFLQVVNNPLIFVNFYSNMRICLSWISSRLYKVVLSVNLRRVVSLSWLSFLHYRSLVKLFLSLPHLLIVKISTLLL